MNLRARMKNKAFWLALTSALVLLAQQLGLDIFPDNAMDIVNTLLLIATILGVIVDPTTPGISDGEEHIEIEIKEVGIDESGSKRWSLSKSDRSKCSNKRTPRG